jgi:hypothetical protein
MDFSTDSSAYLGPKHKKVEESDACFGFYFAVDNFERLKLV